MRGAHNLIAEVDEDQPAFECLRRAGFAVYARQQIWRWEGTPSPEQEVDDVWRSEVPGDGEAIAWLVANLVPGLVLQVEAAPGRSRRGLLHWAEGELRAYLDLERGPRGVWAQPYIHPAVEAIDMLLAAFLRRSAESDRPVYLCLRSYQGWMVGALVRLGFERVAEQAVMVRRLAATVRRAVPAPLPALDGRRVEPTTPFAGMHRPRSPTTRSMSRRCPRRPLRARSVDVATSSSPPPPAVAPEVRISDSELRGRGLKVKRVGELCCPIPSRISSPSPLLSTKRLASACGEGGRGEAESRTAVMHPGSPCGDWSSVR